MSNEGQEELVDFDWDNDDVILNFEAPKAPTAKDLLEEIKNDDGTITKVNKDGKSTTVQQQPGKSDSKQQQSNADSEEFEPFAESKDERDQSTEGESTKGKDKGSNESKPGSKSKDSENGVLTDTETPDEDVEFYTTLSKELKEKGIFSAIELADDEEIDEDKFFELQQQEIEARVDETFEGFFSQLDDDASAFLKYKKDGGNTYDFFRLYSQPTLPLDLNPKDKNDAEAILKHYYRTVDKLDDSELAEKLEWVEEKGKTFTNAESFYTKMLDADRKAKANLLAQQAEATKQAKEATVKLKADLQTNLSKIDKIGDFKITPDDKKTLVPFYMEASVKVGDNRYITPFQKKVAEIMKDPEKAFLLVKLVKNDFDTKDLEKEVKTKITKEIKKTLKDSKQQGINGSGANERGAKQLADYFA